MNEIDIVTVILSMIIFPLILGATIGSFYFLVSYRKSEESSDVVPLIILFTVSFFFGYSAGMIVAETAGAMFVALMSSAIAVEVLDATVRSIRRDEEPPKILSWIVDLVRSIRGK